MNTINVLNIVSSRNKICKFHLVVCIILYLLVVALPLDSNMSFLMMMYFGYYSVAVFSMLLLSELRFQGINIFMLFIFGSFLRLTLPTISMADLGMDGFQFTYYSNYTEAVFPCVIAMNIYYSLFILFLTRFAKDHMMAVDFEILEKIKGIKGIAISLYIIGYLNRFLPNDISFMDSFRRYMTLFPTLSMLILAFMVSRRSDKSLRNLLYIFVIIDVVYAILFSFYKTDILQPVFILIIYYYLNCRYKGRSIINFKFCTSCLLGVLFLFYFVYPFINLKRNDSQWDPATNICYSDYSTHEVFERVLRGDTYDNEEDNQRSDAVLDRQNAIPKNAFFYYEANKNGFKTDILMTAFSLPIPRWLGGGSDFTKHSGYMASQYMDRGNFIVSRHGIHSATYLGLFGSAYFWGGWIGVIIMVMFNSWMIPKFLEYSLRHAFNPFALLILFNIFMGSFTCFEEIHDGGFELAKHYLIYMMIAIALNKTILKRKIYETSI